MNQRVVVSLSCLVSAPRFVTGFPHLIVPVVVQIDLVAWLAQYMESHGFEVDLRDHCGHTPLHLAARSGHASAVAILVAHGADVIAKVRTANYARSQSAYPQALTLFEAYVRIPTANSVSRRSHAEKSYAVLGHNNSFEKF